MNQPSQYCDKCGGEALNLWPASRHIAGPNYIFGQLCRDSTLIFHGTQMHFFQFLMQLSELLLLKWCLNIKP